MIELTRQVLLDAAAMAADADTLLNYAILPTPNPLQVGYRGASLILIVSPKGSAIVTCERIVLTMPIGTNAQNLTASAEGMTSETAPGWDATQDGGQFTLSPTRPGAEKIESNGIAFTFAPLNVNKEVGTCTLLLSEVASMEGKPKVPRRGLIALPKFPAQFFVDPLTVDPASVPSGGSAAVIWKGSSATYSLGYDNGQGRVEQPVANAGSLLVPNLTRFPSVLFTLTVKHTAAGVDQPLVVQRQALVDVQSAKPVIKSFFASVIDARKVKFSFETRNADSCRMTGIAQALNPNATTEAIDINHSRYTLVAHDAHTRSDSEPRSLTVRWRVAASVKVADRAMGPPPKLGRRGCSRVFVTPDGTKVIVVADRGIVREEVLGALQPQTQLFVIDAPTLSARKLAASDSMAFPPALSLDGKRLLAGWVNSAASAYELTLFEGPSFAAGPRGSAAPVEGPHFGWDAHFSPDGSTIYLLVAGFFRLEQRSATDLAFRSVWSPPMPKTLAIAPDGRVFAIGLVHLYGFRQGQGARYLEMDLDHHFPEYAVFDPHRERLFVSAYSNVHKYIVEVIDVGAKRVSAILKVNGAGPVRLSPAGDETYIAIGNSLRVLDAASLAFGAEIPLDEPIADFAFAPDCTIYVLTTTGNLLRLKVDGVT
jgi:hypothetical protein